MVKTAVSNETVYLAMDWFIYSERVDLHFLLAVPHRIHGRVLVFRAFGSFYEDDIV